MQEAAATGSPHRQPPSPTPQGVFTAAQCAPVQRRLAAVQRRLADLAGGRARGPGTAERELERELLRLCERLGKEVEALELGSRCAELEDAVRQRDAAMRELE